MNKKTVFSVGTSVLFSTLILAGVAVAATPAQFLEYLIHSQLESREWEV